VARSRSDPSKVYFTVWFEWVKKSDLGIEEGEDVEIEDGGEDVDLNVVDDMARKMTIQ
jgi:hypothetical protein